MLVSVVVPTVNGGSLLLRCLESVLSQKYQPLEIILVDNGSNDGSQTKVLELCPDARIVVNSKNEGFAKACNQGARTTTGDYILFLNSDVVMTPEALTRMVKAAEEEAYGILQPVILNTDGSVDSTGDSFTWTGFLWHQKVVKESSRVLSVFAVKGACMLVKRSWFQALGGFNESYFAYFEETDLCWRARMIGCEVGVVPSAEVYHEGGATTGRILRPPEIYYLSFRNRLRSILANPSGVSLARILILHLLGCCGTAAAFFVRGRPSSGIAILSAVSWPFMNPRDVVCRRRSVQSARRVSDKGVFRPELTTNLSVHRAATLLQGTVGRWQDASGSS